MRHSHEVLTAQAFDQDGVSKPKVVGANPKRDEAVCANHILLKVLKIFIVTSLCRRSPVTDIEAKEQDAGVNFGALLNDY